MFIKFPWRAQSVPMKRVQATVVLVCVVAGLTSLCVRAVAGLTSLRVRAVASLTSQFDAKLLLFLTSLLLCSLALADLTSSFLFAINIGTCAGVTGGLTSMVCVVVWQISMQVEPVPVIFRSCTGQFCTICDQFGQCALIYTAARSFK